MDITIDDIMNWMGDDASIEDYAGVIHDVIMGNYNQLGLIEDINNYKEE